MNAVGIIFANTYDVDLNELTQKRTLAAVPFAGRYRLIDFTLSNMRKKFQRSSAESIFSGMSGRWI